MYVSYIFLKKWKTDVTYCVLPERDLAKSKLVTLSFIYISGEK